MGISRHVCRAVTLIICLPLVVISSLLAVAAIRALLIEDIDYQFAEFKTSGLDDIPESYLESFPEVFGASLRIPTVSTAPGDYDKEQILVFHQFLRDSFPDVFNSSFVKAEVINSYSLLLTIRGTDESLQPYMLAAHLDVVPVDESKWSQAPFGGQVLPDPETGEMFVWGRGAIDNKINLMSIMMALQYLITTGFQPRRTFYASFGHDEEVNGYDGAGHIGRILEERGVVLDFLLDEGLPMTLGVVKGLDVPVAAIGVTEKGWMSVTLETEGEGGHSSAPPIEQVAPRLGRAMHNLEQYPQPSMFGTGPESEMFSYLASSASWPYKMFYANLWLFKPLLELIMSRQRNTNAFVRTTTAVTMVRVGVKENVVPSSGYVMVNHRVHPGQSLHDVLQHDISVIDDPKVKVKVLRQREAHPVSPYGPKVPGWRLIVSATKHIYPTSVAAPGILIANTDTRYYLNITSNIYRFYPVLLTEDEIGRIHGTNERLSVANAKNAVRFYHRVMVTADRDPATVVDQDHSPAVDSDNSTDTSIDSLAGIAIDNSTEISTRNSTLDEFDV
ncbi:N-fatty-acyl-amino acid synthase/hydrolase PM20D1-like isoform X1 [Macrobrachium rosenbergii]|uniref:N-fatty-acyl-amino acid synthase/hydrolase PM20D1-like isoform X1 n=1 Tax=Macrobrachium rosenbergii TaxID=79674 RepID=UPI0034D3BEB3